MGDDPIPFGYKNSWLAIASKDQSVVIRSLGLRDLKQCTWQKGIAHTYGEATMVFVSPVVDGWILVVGSFLFPGPGDSDPHKPKFIPYLEEISKSLGHVQYFATHRITEYHAWAKAESGVVRRAFAYLGESGEVLLKIGKPSPEEISAGWQDDSEVPSEETVMDIAAKWSLNPQLLDSLPKSAMGEESCELGKLPFMKKGA
jgi:hypothetical protein